MISQKRETRILLVDDHEVVRLGLRTLLEREAEFRVVGEAGTAEEAIERTLALRPNVVVMDIRLPRKSGIDACREIVRRLPETKVIMLTSYAEDELLFDAIDAGAAGYVLKQVGSDDLVRAIRTVGRGESLLSPEVTARVMARVRQVSRQSTRVAFANLTEQELRVLAMVAVGKTNREIAHTLHLSDGTVRNYVSTILGKLGLGNRAEAAAYAVKNRIADLVPFLPPGEGWGEGGL
jgi:DNA-binding NarL/FixJ family response regulator